eukprot:UN33712
MLWLILLVCVVYGGHLTKDNWDQKTLGKSVFVLYYRPGCVHCEKLKPAWFKLVNDYKDHEYILVGLMNCLIEQEFCNNRK